MCRTEASRARAASRAAHLGARQSPPTRSGRGSCAPPSRGTKAKCENGRGERACAWPEHVPGPDAVHNRADAQVSGYRPEVPAAMQLVPSGLRLVSLTCDPPLRASGHALRGMGAAAQAAAQRSVGAGADRFPRARRIRVQCGHQDQQGVEESDDHSGTGWIKRTAARIACMDR